MAQRLLFFMPLTPYCMLCRPVCGAINEALQHAWLASRDDEEASLQALQLRPDVCRVLGSQLQADCQKQTALCLCQADKSCAPATYS